jgi:hypothetical protein
LEISVSQRRQPMLADFITAPVPEPAGVALLVGAATVAARSRRRR